MKILQVLFRPSPSVKYTRFVDFLREGREYMCRRTISLASQRDAREKPRLEHQSCHCQQGRHRKRYKAVGVLCGFSLSLNDKTGRRITVIEELQFADVNLQSSRMFHASAVKHMDDDGTEDVEVVMMNDVDKDNGKIGNEGEADVNGTDRTSNMDKADKDDTSVIGDPDVLSELAVTDKAVKANKKGKAKIGDRDVAVLSEVNVTDKLAKLDKDVTQRVEEITATIEDTDINKHSGSDNEQVVEITEELGGVMDAKLSDVADVNKNIGAKDSNESDLSSGDAYQNIDAKDPKSSDSGDLNKNNDIKDLSDQTLTTVETEEDESGKKNKSRKKTSKPEKLDESPEIKLSQMVLNPQNYMIQKRISEYFQENNLTPTESHTGYFIVCPKFGKVAMRRKKEEQSIYVNYLTGEFKCIACGKTGNWDQLRDNMTHIRLTKGRNKSKMECLQNVLVQTAKTKRQEKQIEEVQKLLDSADKLAQVNNEEFENILSLFDWQGITKETVRKYGVKYKQEGNKYTVYFPLVSLNQKLTGSRVYAAVINEDEEVSLEPVHTIPKVYTAVINEDEEVSLEPVHTIPKFQDNEMFGWQTRPVPDNKNYFRRLVITSGEIQAMAVTQGTTLTAVSIRNINDFPQEHVPTLEKFEKIYLWFGSDLKSWEMSKFAARKLNEKRCMIFRPDNDNDMPLECLQMEVDIRQKVKLARPLCHEAIHSFNDLRLSVYKEFCHHEQVAGVKWKRYDKLNNILKGFRQGELTVLTGHTGSGKTTFLSDYSLDLCMQGVKTLWGSFEICNIRLIKMMMQQFSGINLTKHLNEFNDVAEKFSELPMFFMAYHGQQKVDTVLETMCHAVYVHNIQHVIIDNLQFMVGMDKFDDQTPNIFIRQDRIVSQFRKFATDNNCHVTLIIHPRKVDKGEELSISSIFGSAKVSQESDNVILVQDNRLTKPGGRKYLQISKNRFDGDVGVMVLTFNKDSLSYTMSEKRKPGTAKEEF